VTLGQRPNILHLQELLHIQITGDPPSGDLTVDKLKEVLRHRMASAKVLLVLDDCWDPAHEAVLNTANADSATMVTTRIKGLLADAAQVELGLPSTDESVRLLLAAAGLDHCGSPPPEAAEVVRICGNLPLAVDLAGKFVRELGVEVGEWGQVPTILRHELRNAADSDDASVEERLVTASLGSIPKRDRDTARAVFEIFGSIEEDTFVPPAAYINCNQYCRRGASAAPRSRCARMRLVVAPGWRY
jgi:hypothetical protein